MSVISRPLVEQLREQVRAQVITAGDPGYDAARAVHNGMLDKRPAAVVRALPAVGGNQARVRPRQPLPPEPEHPASPLTSSACARDRRTSG